MNTQMNYGEKVVSSGSAFNINIQGVNGPMKLDIDEKNLSIGELFSEYRQLGLPLNNSTYNQTSELKPEHIYKAHRRDQEDSTQIILFEFKDGSIIEIPTFPSVLGIKFQKEMIGYLNQRQDDTYKEMFGVADRCFTKSDRTLGDVIKYATDSVPATTNGYLSINKKVSSFQIHNRPGNNDVLAVTYDKSQKETLIQLKETNLTKDERREFLDTKSKENILKRSFTR